MSESLPAASPINGAAAVVDETLAPAAGSKRQRRPSVRLGDIGHQPAAVPPDPHARRSKQWKLPPWHHQRTNGLSAAAAASDSVKPLSNILSPSRDGKQPRRSRSNWAPKSYEAAKGTDLKWKSSSGEDFRDEGYAEDSESLSDTHHKRAEARARVLDPEADSMDGDVPSEMGDRNGGWSHQLGGVRPWLNRLGLDRYAPLFEIHEVDNKVLPLLTLEDLKDMGINAVGSRRKMYYAIQKLRKNVA